jgi:type I restriction enzyme S subunit
MSSTSLKIGDVITISKGKKHSIIEEPAANSRRLIAIDDLRNDNLLRYTNDKKGTDVTTNDILIAWDGANAGTIGYGKEGLI